MLVFGYAMCAGLLEPYHWHACSPYGHKRPWQGLWGADIGLQLMGCGLLALRPSAT